MFMGLCGLPVGLRRGSSILRLVCVDVEDTAIQV